MWADLSVVYEDASSTPADNVARRRHLLRTAHQLGYDAIAWSTTLVGRLPKQITPPERVEWEEQDASTSETAITASGRQAFRMLSGTGWAATKVGHEKTRAKVPSQTRRCEQYTRLTVILDETSNPHDLSATNTALQQFDVIAVRPVVEKHFQAACATLEIDVISLDLSSRLPFKLKFATIGQALKRGIHFEISLAPPLRDPHCRKHWLSNALDLLRITKGRNMIFTSEALDPIHLRSPHDLANLAAMLGLTFADGRVALSQHPFSVLKHGETRRTQKAVLAAMPVSAAASWQIPSDPSGQQTTTKRAKRKRSTGAEQATSD